MIFFKYTLIILFFFEIIIAFLIKFFNKKIPWVISNIDEYPIFDKKKLTNFIKKTHDYKLGWNWKHNSRHQEIIFSKKIKILFGDLGERKNVKNIKLKKKINFACFGDSFVFCRYVENSKTWQEQLSGKIGYRGLNFGVGNYGLDQAYLKYKHTKLPNSVKNIFVGFVPETMSRCLCIWKHYHEFNNLYAFKPKFIINKKKLKLLKNPIKNIDSFNQIYEIIDKLKKREYFYNNKFLKHKLTFPFIFSFTKNFKYNFLLFYYSCLKVSNINRNKIFELVISKNCKENDKLYLEKKNQLLIKKIMNEANLNAKKNNQNIYFLILPQKYDLFLKKKNYHNFYSDLKKKLNIIDFTEIFKNHNIKKIYLPDQYGGHLSAYGNKIVADTLFKRINFKLNKI